MKKYSHIIIGVSIILLTMIFYMTVGFLFGENRNLNKAYKLAGENKPELKKVLANYEKGTLKHKAAKYLITNLPGHIYYSGNYSPQFQSLLSIAHSCEKESIEERKEIIKASWDSIQDVQGYLNIRSLPIEADVYAVKADYLIAHIDSSFVAWQSHWGKHLSFEDFCRYLLPYRIDTEPLEDWRSSIANQNPWLQTLKNSNISAFEACCIINDSLKNWVAVASTFDHLPRQCASDLLLSHTGNCIDISNFTSLVMRTAGLPVASIRCPGGHAWNVLLDQDGILKDFMGAEHNPVRDFGGMYYHKFKVDMMKAYLKTFHVSKESKKLLRSDKLKNLPPFFKNFFLEDISKDVLFRRELEISIIKKNTSNRPFIYLNQLLPSWIEGVTIDKIDYPQDTKAFFKNTSKRGTYFAATYKDGAYDYVSHCITILQNDSTHVWKPNWNQSVSCQIFRKTPMSPGMKDFSEKLVGAVFQGANKSDFSDAYDLSKINDVFDHLDGNSFTTPKKLRYVRLVPLDTNSVHVAELKFLKNGVEVNGQAIGSADAENLKNAFDGDIRTNFNGKVGDWIGLDFGKPTEINSFKILPRNNFNIIEPGDLYELFVLDTAHISLGTKIASGNFLQYDNIPSGGLLYLLNKSRGKEFNHFFVLDEKQEWNLLNYKNLTTQ